MAKFGVRLVSQSHEYKPPLINIAFRRDVCSTYWLLKLHIGERSTATLFQHLGGLGRLLSTPDANPIAELHSSWAYRYDLRQTRPTSRQRVTSDETSDESRDRPRGPHKNASVICFLLRRPATPNEYKAPSCCTPRVFSYRAMHGAMCPVVVRPPRGFYRPPKSIPPAAASSGETIRTVEAVSG